MTDDDLDRAIRRAVADVVEAAPPAPAYDDLAEPATARHDPGRRSMIVGSIAAAVALVVGLVTVIADRRADELRTGPTSGLTAPDLSGPGTLLPPTETDRPAVLERADRWPANGDSTVVLRTPDGELALVRATPLHRLGV